MSDARDSFADLEKHRLRLEDNVSQLQKALQHWQTWDAEYEGLREEVEAVTAADEAKELQRIHGEFDGELLGRTEMDEIFGQPKLKTKEQIVNVLERRIDYVSKNIETLQKQLETAENKHAAATVISQPDATDEDGQPILDIVEELDDDDNVVSFRLNKPGESFGDVEALLKKAGISDDSRPEAEKKDAVSEKAENQEKASKTKEPVLDSVASSKPPSTAPEYTPKKSVSFSEDTKVAEEPEQEPEISWRAKRVKEIMSSAKDQEDLGMQAAVIPKDESPEDAALRQQMLRYGMSEVGAVVAELELEEGNSDEDEGIDEDFDDEFDEDDEDDEDQYGRYKGSVVTDKYRQRMLQLEQKLGIKSQSSMSQSKADEAESSDNDYDEGIGRILVKQETDTSSLPTAPKAAVPVKSNLKEKQVGDNESKKGVRFAPSLDIAPESEPSAPTISEQKKDLVEPLGDIIERSSSSKPVQPPAQPAKRASRFKKARDTTDPASAVPKGPLDIRPKFMEEERQQVPTGPEGATIADTLVEREHTAAAIAPDEVNDAMTHQEVADEYQRMRRKFIQREGGFLKPDESPVKPIRDEENEEPISRFKAARLSRQ
ncbi:Prefoldin subunit domain-containing protein [Trichoderma austrokoningii]